MNLCDLDIINYCSCDLLAATNGGKDSSRVEKRGSELYEAEFTRVRCCYTASRLDVAASYRLRVLSDQ